MLDVSFSELVLILIVGLLVFGPEKLPEVIRTTGAWISKIRRSFNQIRSEIEREVGVDEIKREIHNQSILDSLKEVRNDLNQAHQNLRDLPYDIKDIVERQHKPVEPVQFDTVSNDDFRHNDTPPIDTPLVDTPSLGSPSAETPTVEPQPTSVKPTASQSS